MIKKINSAIYPFFAKFKVLVKTYVMVDPVFVSRQRFKRDDRRLDLRGTYDLNADSVIFDLGGYVGDWSLHMFKKYGCNIYLFEPVDRFIDQVRVKFKDNPRVHLFSFGVSDRDGTEKINLHDNASSLFAVGTGSMDIKMRDAAAVIRDLQIKKIDLLKLNIEGGEFKVLPRMIECGLISLCTDIQVQFHDFYPDAKRLRDDIRAELSKTHYLTYDYPFTFENWRKNA